MSSEQRHVHIRVSEQTSRTLASLAHDARMTLGEVVEHLVGGLTAETTAALVATGKAARARGQKGA